MTARTAIELMQQFWSAQQARGEKPRRVFGLVSPATGEVVTWGVLRAYIEAQHDRRGDKDKLEIREFHPEATP